MALLEQILGDVLTYAFRKAGFDSGEQKVSVSNRPDLCEYQNNGALSMAKRLHRNPMEIASSVCDIIRALNVSDVVNILNVSDVSDKGGFREETGETGKGTERESLKNLKGQKGLEGIKGLSGNLESHRIFSMAEAVKPGFINLNLDDTFLTEYLNEMASDPELSIVEKPEGKKILVDYGGANVAKPLHVGHLRSAVIGEALKRLCRKMGNQVTGDVHLGDWGLQMGLIIEELRERGKLDSELTMSELEEIYPLASSKTKAKDEAGNPVYPGFAERAHETTLKLQNGDPNLRKVWERILTLSVSDLKKNYDALDVHFDLWKGESDAEPYIPGLIQDLLDKGLAYSSEGALVVDIAEPGDKKEFPPCMIRKSDGASLYATSDLGTLIEREKLYSPDRYIYVADIRQSLHYTQFFRVARKAGFVRPEAELTFIGFGTMNGRDGKPFKTREGGVLRLESLIDETRTKVLEKIRLSRGDEISGEEAGKNADLIALSALKYGDLSNQAIRDYVFDIDRFTAFEGNTGPYILYTMVRISSIFRKYAEREGLHFENTGVFLKEYSDDFRIPCSDEKVVHDLKLLIAGYRDRVSSAYRELAPHKICTYIYDLSNTFNSFYHDVNILKEPDIKRRRGYISLIMLLYRVLNECIYILGFSAPERM